MRRIVVALLLVPSIGWAQDLPPQPASLLDPLAATPPVAPIEELVIEMHGDRLVDDYAWMSGEDDQRVLDYVAAENAYLDTVMAPVSALEQALFDEMTGRLADSDRTYPIRFGDYWYFWQVGADEDYWSLYRHAGSRDGPVETVIDVNALAEGHDYFSVPFWDVSEDGRYLAYAVSTTGGIDYHTILHDLETGEDIGAPIEGTDSALWAPDASALYYIATDDTLRGYELRRHVPGSDGPDQVIYTEDDPEYWLSSFLTSDNRFLAIFSAASDTSEIRLLDIYDPDAEPILVRPREEGIWYGATHAGNQLVVRINDTSEFYRLAATSIPEIVAGVDSAAWETLVPARDDIALTGANIFTRFIQIYIVEDGLKKMEIYDRATGAVRQVAFPDPAYTVYSEWNPSDDTDAYLYVYESMIAPQSIYALDMATAESTLVDRAPIAGPFDSEDYEVRRLFATAPDGTQIPISLAMARGTPLDGSAPLLIEAYGAYGYANSVYFDFTKLSLMDRGVIYAMAHVRGGGELGDPWYDGGRMANKMNTFTDVIAVAEHLIAEGYTSADRLALTGGSAGGLTVGAVLNMRPDLFAAAILDVPFVDVLNVMLDPSLPLTTGEYNEWGNPNEAEEYGWIRAYDPYYNLADRDYPAMLLTTAVGDEQVRFWEVAKYVARIRALNGDDLLLLLHTDMDSGHGGDSGRHERYRAWAMRYAFLLGALGIGE